MSEETGPFAFVGLVAFVVVVCVAGLILFVAMVAVPCLAALGILAVKDRTARAKRRASEAGPEDVW